MRVVASSGGKTVAEAEGEGIGGEALTLKIPKARLWSPDDPFFTT